MGSRSHIIAASYSYSVILESQEGGGFTVLVPALPEVVTEQEALANAEEAIRAIVEYRREHKGWRLRPMLIPKFAT